MSIHKEFSPPPYRTLKPEDYIQGLNTHWATFPELLSKEITDPQIVELELSNFRDIMGVISVLWSEGADILRSLQFGNEAYIASSEEEIFWRSIGQYKDVSDDKLVAEYHTNRQNLIQQLSGLSNELLHSDWPTEVLIYGAVVNPLHVDTKEETSIKIYEK